MNASITYYLKIMDIHTQKCSLITYRKTTQNQSIRVSIFLKAPLPYIQRLQRLGLQSLNHSVSGNTYEIQTNEVSSFG